MDVQMPNLNGFETASALIYERDKLKHILHHLIITANTYDEDIAFKELLQAGAVRLYLQALSNANILARQSIGAGAGLYRKDRRAYSAGAKACGH